MAYTWRCQPSKGRRSSECLSPCAEVFGVYGPIPIEHLIKKTELILNDTGTSRVRIGSRIGAKGGARVS